MPATTMVHVRVDERIKAEATETLAAMGLTVSDAVRVFLTRVVADTELPFSLRVPNPATQTAMQEASEIIQARGARFDNVEALIKELEKDGRK